MNKAERFYLTQEIIQNLSWTDIRPQKLSSSCEFADQVEEGITRAFGKNEFKLFGEDDNTLWAVRITDGGSSKLCKRILKRLPQNGWSIAKIQNAMKAPEKQVHNCVKYLYQLGYICINPRDGFSFIRLDKERIDDLIRQIHSRAKYCKYNTCYYSTVTPEELSVLEELYPGGITRFTIEFFNLDGYIFKFESEYTKDGTEEIELRARKISFPHDNFLKAVKL